MYHFPCKFEAHVATVTDHRVILVCSAKTCTHNGLDVVSSDNRQLAQPLTFHGGNKINGINENLSKTHSKINSARSHINLTARYFENRIHTVIYCNIYTVIYYNIFTVIYCNIYTTIYCNIYAVIYSYIVNDSEFVCKCWALYFHLMSFNLSCLQIKINQFSLLSSISV